jgi:hypothetical protein
MRAAFVEWSIFQDQQDIAVDPELQVSERQEDTSGFRSAVVDLFEASRECGFLLVSGELRQQQRMADVDLIGIERLDRCGDKVKPAGRYLPSPGAWSSAS